MIVVKLMGGLGNQMFQYAAGKALAKERATDLFLDLGWYEGQKAAGDTSRLYELDAFAISGQLANRFLRRAAFISEFPPTRKTRLARMFWGPLPRLKIVRQEGSGFDPKFKDSPDNSLLIGWWQSEKFFLSAEEEIRKDFNFAHQPTKNVADILAKIEESNSVSIHVRRGDYATNADTNKHHGLIPVEYYKKASATVAQQTKTPLLFIFSDDIEWCRKNLKLEHPSIYVKHDGADYEDLRLMSSCKHNIIANSSFSWWGAWLNPNDDKIIVAPKRWFADKEANEKMDNIPEDWVRL